MCIIRGGSRDSVDGGEGGLSYGAIFSIIDVTNYSPKAVLACRSINLVFISFSVQQRKATVIDFRTLCFNIISHYLSPAYSRFFYLYIQRFTYFSTPLKTMVVELFNIWSVVSELNLRLLRLCLCQVIFLVVILQRTFVSWNDLCPIQMLYS